jgi:hypothetical protein
METKELLQRAIGIASFMEDYHSNVGGHNSLLTEKAAQLVTILNKLNEQVHN